MLGSSFITLFLTGLGLGLLHAFDTDHLVAVSALSSHRANLKKTLNYSFHWTIGHSVVLLILGLYASLLDLKLPLFLSHWAELLVGVMLIILGIWTLFQLKPDLLKSSNQTNNASNGKPEHITHNAPLMVGIVHGTAGSATVLALIPVMQLSSPIFTAIYLTCFAIGIFFSMSLFAILFSHSQQRLAKVSHNFYIYFRVALGAFAIGLGFVWLL